MNIRPAEMKDLPEISMIEASAYHPELVTSLHGFEKIFREATHEDYLIVFLREDRVCGFCHFSMNQQQSGECGIWDIAVAKNHKGTGIGKALLKHTIEKARACKMKRVFLHVPEDNPVAMALYTSVGFSVTGRIPKYYPPQGATEGEFTIDGLIMSLSLQD